MKIPVCSSLRLLIAIITLLFIIPAKSFAQDTTQNLSKTPAKGSPKELANGKKPFYISFGAGYTLNSVFGSMHDRNVQYGYPMDGKIHMKDNGSFIIQVQLQKYFAPNFYLSGGLNYISKRVNPMEGTISIYKDSLNTGYLSVPVYIGANVLPVISNSFNIFFELGAITNFKVVDKSSSGPDRVGFKTQPVTFSLSPGLGLSLATSPTQKFIFQYHFMYDLSNAYVETLYWSSAEPNKNFVYKYKTSVFSLAYQWQLK
ncbi:MAG TPA: outer membrane beta-barrel protein [Puia sp.]|nr:outer membrane beta-barrel protein [Puia sp.]